MDFLKNMKKEEEKEKGSTQEEGAELTAAAAVAELVVRESNYLNRLQHLSDFMYQQKRPTSVDILRPYMHSS